MWNENTKLAKNAGFHEAYENTIEGSVHLIAKPLGNKDLAESNQWTTEEGKTQEGWWQNRNQGIKC